MTRRHPWITVATAALVAANVVLLTSCRQTPKVAPAPSVGRWRDALREPPVLRVEVERPGASVVVAVDGPYEAACGRVVSAARLPATAVKLAPGGFLLGSQRLRGEKLAITSRGGQPIRVGKRRYLGRIVIERASPSALSVVNEIDPETLAYGVVTSEMPSRWPMDALKAQAVAIRTFVLNRWWRRRGKRIHVTQADVRYLGLANDTARGRQAVDETRGLVLAYGDALLPAYFMSTCGGHTAPVDQALGERLLPPLAGVPCGYCEDATYYSWTYRVSQAELARKLGLSAGESIVAIRPDAPGRYRHASRIEVETNRGAKTFGPYRFRLALGAGKLKSTAFTVRKSGRAFIFDGRGWGHGVGLCQWGAKGLAQAGTDWRGILAHYYPGADLVSAY